MSNKKGADSVADVLASLRKRSVVGLSLVGFGLLGIVISLAVEESEGAYRTVLKLLFAGLIIVSGVILFASSRKGREARSAERGDKSTAAAFDGSRDVEADEYRLYLVRKYSIEKNAVLEKYVVGTRLFESLSEALGYAHELDIRE